MTKPPCSAEHARHQCEEYKNYKANKKAHDWMPALFFFFQLYASAESHPEDIVSSEAV